MARHPHDQTLQCSKRQGETLFDANGFPVSITGKPCRCRLWTDVIQQADATSGEPARRVQGCFFELWPWIHSGAIYKASVAAAEAAAARKDIQSLTSSVQAGFEQGFRMLAARLISPEALLLAAQSRPELPGRSDGD